MISTTPLKAPMSIKSKDIIFTTHDYILTADITNKPYDLP